MNDPIPLEPDTGDKLTRLKEIKDQLESLKQEYDDLVTEVVVPMEAPEFVVIDGKKYRVSRVASSDPVYDYAAMERLLTEEQRAAITETKIVGAKLKAEVQTGRIDPEVAMDIVTYRPKRPYPKFDPLE